MSWDKGFNFRLTSGFVTDGTNQTYALGSEAYPTTRNGVTFGWSVGNYGSDLTDNDRDNTVDPRFAGQNQVTGTVTDVFRVDLTAAGSYDIRFASGDTGFDFGPYGPSYIEVFDNVTSLFSRSFTGPAQDHYQDASGVDRTEAAWPGSNVASTQTFASTILNFKMSSAVSGYTVIAHLFLSQAGAAYDAATFQAMLMQTQAGAAMIGRACRGVYG